MFVAALVAIANNTCKHSKCPSMDERIKEMFVYNGILFTAIEKEENCAICNNIDEPWGHLGK